MRLASDLPGLAVLTTMHQTHKAVRDGSLKHVSYFSVSATAKELDRKFAEVVNATPLDTDDRLAVRLSWEGTATHPMQVFLY